MKLGEPYCAHGHMPPRSLLLDKVGYNLQGTNHKNTSHRLEITNASDVEYSRWKIDIESYNFSYQPLFKISLVFTLLSNACLGRAC